MNYGKFWKGGRSVPRAYLLKEWAYPILLFFFLFTFLALFFSSLGITVFSFWQKALIFFISPAFNSIFQRFLFPIIYFLLFIFFVYLIKLEFFPVFLENITVLKDEVGQIRVSQKALWEVVERKLSTFPYVKALKMYVTCRDEKFFLYLHVNLVGDDSDLEDVKQKAYVLASELREYIYEGIGLKIDEVNVVIEGLKYTFREEEIQSGRE